MIQTIDGKIHAGRGVAIEHLEKIVESRLGAIVDQLRHKKPLEMFDILRENLRELAEIAKYEKDAFEVEKIDDEK